ncbi:peptidoglycan bridge formation glycyltransferase FemA/FemB family protein, partial [bacterium]|nr:peptidoglycan bridge formation glycyltransferase FemA/FemB family protein [bacterium]
KVLSQKGECVLLLAKQDRKLLAARTICFFGSHAAEFHAGSVDSPDNLHANYLLVWEAIRLAKSKGCVSYDFWGIPDDIEGNVELDKSSYTQRRDGLWGVYRFKSGFSRNVISYIGAYDFVYAAIPYAITANSLIESESFEKILVWVDSL